MTANDFTAKHGLDWIKFQTTQMGQDFLTIFETEHPSRNLPKGKDQLGLLTNGAVALLNDIAGFEKAAEIIRHLGDPKKPVKPEPPDRFTDSEIQ